MVAIALLGGYYCDTGWLLGGCCVFLWCCYGVARCCFVFTMVLLGGCYGVARWLLGLAVVLRGYFYGVARCLLWCFAWWLL